MIKNINIRNFKCFPNETIHFENLTVLAGINSVGKSTIIQALLLIRQTVDYIKLYNEGASQIRNMRISLNDKYCLQLGNSIEVLNANAEINEIIFSISDTANIKLNFAYLVSKDSPELFLTFPNEDGMTCSDDSKYSILKKQFHYLNTERIGPRVRHEMSEQIFPSTGYRGEYTSYVISKHSEDKIKESRRIRNPELTVHNLNKQVEYWLDYIIPGVQFKTDVYEKINSVGMGLQRKGSGTGFLNPNNLGFGISYVLPIIVSGLLSEEGSLLIVENPEVHLHPSGQSRIGQFLAQVAASGVQVILETHSEHVINGIRIAALKNIIDTSDVTINFLNLDEKLKNVNIENITLNKHSELVKWPKGFLDQEQQDLLEMVHLRKGLRKRDEL